MTGQRGRTGPGNKGLNEGASKGPARRHHLHGQGSCIVLMRGPLGVADLRDYGSFWRVTGYGPDYYGTNRGSYPTKRQAIRAALVFAREFYLRAGLLPVERL